MTLRQAGCESKAFPTQQLVAVNRVQEIQFQVVNQDRHPFIGLLSETLPTIYFHLKIFLAAQHSTEYAVKDTANHYALFS